MEYLGEDYKRIVKALIHSDKERKKRIRRGTATAFDIKVDNAITTHLGRCWEIPWSADLCSTATDQGSCT